jgi:hypothetical protein
MYDLGLLVTDSPIKTARKAEQCCVWDGKETAGASAGSRECVISPPEKKKKKKTRAGNILGNVLVELQS